jgi:SagB-type dehydrogenase family enzyme
VRDLWCIVEGQKERDMNRRTFLKVMPTAVLAAAASHYIAQADQADSGSAQPAGKAPTSGPDGTAAPGPVGDLEPIVLVKPQKDGGKSVLAALADRQTTRTISDKKLPPQELSNLLWAAFGVNREKGPAGQIGRTAASASNSQEIDIYVALAEGVYLYDAVGHRLIPVVVGDLRSKAGRGRRGGATAPVRLIYVADIAKFAKAKFQEPGLKDPDVQKSYYCIDAGLIAGNVYLYAASAGLAAWFHNCDKTGVAKELKLRPEQQVLYGHTVGYPA